MVTKKKVVKKVAGKINNKKAQKPAPIKINFAEEIAELHILLRALGEEAIAMRDGGKLAEREREYFGDIVTEADKMIEHEIVKRIQARHPDHRVRGEQESAVGPEEGEFEWIVNPIDGTKNFSKGLTFFSIAVALLANGEPVLGVVYFPELARFISAAKGHGAHENGNMIKMFARPGVTDMRRALIAAATTSRKQGRMPILNEIRMGSLNLLNTGSLAYNSLLLAERKIDASLHTDASIFDVAALIPILEEAGCHVCGFASERPNLTQESIPVIFAENADLARNIKENLAPHWRVAEK